MGTIRFPEASRAKTVGLLKAMEHGTCMVRSLPRTAVRRALPRGPHLPRHAQTMWDEAMAELAAKLQGRPRDRRGLSPYDNRSGTIRRYIYRLVRSYRRSRQLNIIKKVVHSLHNEPLKVPFNANPFYWALYAAKQDDDIDLTDQEVSRYATQMVYADKHRVEPEFLIGFVYQQGNHADLAQKLRDGLTEEFFW